MHTRVPTSRSTTPAVLLQCAWACHLVQLTLQIASEMRSAGEHAEAAGFLVPCAPTLRDVADGLASLDIRQLAAQDAQDLTDLLNRREALQARLTRDGSRASTGGRS